MAEGQDTETTWTECYCSKEKMKKILMSQGLDARAAMFLKRGGTVQIIGDDGIVTMCFAQEKEDDGKIN